ncbi:MAG: hypothetical protein AB2L14_04330 [Candidatus Xenobiia bacterium LiM19]
MSSHLSLWILAQADCFRTVQSAMEDNDAAGCLKGSMTVKKLGYSAAIWSGAAVSAGSFLNISMIVIKTTVEGVQPRGPAVAEACGNRGLR